MAYSPEIRSSRHQRALDPESLGAAPGSGRYAARLARRSAYVRPDDLILPLLREIID